MSDGQRLALVRAVHTAIYGVMAASAFVLLFAGVTGAHGWWLWVAGGLMAVEVAVFAGSGMRCPLTAVAVKNGSVREGVGDTFLPERVTRHTLRFFGPLLGVGVVLLVVRAFWFGWG